MKKTEELNLLMNEWEIKHRNKGYQRFIRDGIVCEKQWEAQKTPRVCFFLKEAYTEEDNFNLTDWLHTSDKPRTMWRKVAIWTQAMHNAFGDNVEYNDGRIRSNEKEIIETISAVNVKKSNGKKNSDYDDLKKYAEEDKEELKKELEIIQPDIILCGNNMSLLKIVLGDELKDDNAWNDMIAKWNKTLVIDYYHPAVQYPNRVNFYALTAICNAAIKKYNLQYKHD